jgi:opacity protein-like surface antigen
MRRLCIIAFITCLICFASTAAWANGKVGLSIMGGWAYSTAGDAMSGRDGDPGPADSSFQDNWTIGAEATYKFASGLILGIGIQHLTMTAEAARSGENKDDFAKLKMTPIYALARYQYPVQTGFTGHVEAGLGFNLTSADKENALHNMETVLGQSIDSSTSDSLAGFVGAGVGYYFKSNLSLGLSLRYWWTKVDYDISASRMGNFSKGTFDGQNLQTLLNLTYWL